MNKIEILNPFVGIFGMVVCAEEGVTDEEILSFCNKENPSGTSNGWSEIIRGSIEHPKRNPVRCADNPERWHLIVTC
jgi:hypothetical protein